MAEGWMPIRPGEMVWLEEERRQAATRLNEYIRCVRAIQDTLFAYLLTTQEPHALKLIAEINRHIDALPKVEEPQP